MNDVTIDETPSRSSPLPAATSSDGTRRLAMALALACILCLLAMTAITLTTGVSQEQLEVVRTIDDYRGRLVAGEPVLRVLMAIDTLFLALYAAFFVAFADVHREGRPTVAVRIGVAALLAVAVLDVIEDHHILALARAAVLGESPSMGSILFQHVESQTKFAISYAGLIFLGIGLPRRDRVERAFALSLAGPLPVLGSVIWSLGPPVEAPLALVRAALFVSGFVGAIAILSRDRTRLRCSGVTPR